VIGVAAFVAFANVNHDAPFGEALVPRMPRRGGFRTQAETRGYILIILVITTIVKRRIWSVLRQSAGNLLFL
jgi:hypothetical protein